MILLLGDSITQMGSNEYDGYPGWVAHMQAHYNRKVRAGCLEQVCGSSCGECVGITAATELTAAAAAAAAAAALASYS